VYKYYVAGSQRAISADFLPARTPLFAYNEVPTFAVAKRLLVQGASLNDAPFFLARSI
jgi:hypothetical protein